jgi:hypothetical protein
MRVQKFNNFNFSVPVGRDYQDAGPDGEPLEEGELNEDMSDDGGGQDYEEDSPPMMRSAHAAPTATVGGAKNPIGPAGMGGGISSINGSKAINVGGGGGVRDIGIGGGVDEEGYKDIAMSELLGGGGVGGGGGIVGNDYVTWTDENGKQMQSNTPRCRTEFGPNGDVIGESCVL